MLKLKGLFVKKQFISRKARSIKTFNRCDPKNEKVYKMFYYSSNGSTLYGIDFKFVRGRLWSLTNDSLNGAP